MSHDNALAIEKHDANVEIEEADHECDSGCSEQCDRETDVIGYSLQQPGQVVIEDLVERLLELL